MAGGDTRPGQGRQKAEIQGLGVKGMRHAGGRILPMPAPTLQQRLTARQAPVARSAVLRQIWSRLLFLHWEVPVPNLAAHLPAGLTVDTWEGRAFLGVVPFAMRRGSSPGA